MAHLHFRQTVYKAGGDQATSRVAYISRQPVKELDRVEQQLRYLGVSEGPQRREDLVATASHNLPAWAHGKAHSFFAAAERHERKNGVAFVEWKITLPRELSHGQNLDLAHDIFEASFGRTHAYTYAFHDPPAADGERQPHIHVLWSARTLDGIDRGPAHFFKRWNAAAPGHGGARKDPELNHMGAIFAARQMVCDLTNVHLEQHGHAARLGPRSLEERGIARAPEMKLLPSDSNALKHRCEVTERMQHVFDARYARAQSAPAEMANAEQYWQERKMELGISRDMPMDQQLERIRADRTQAITRLPERRPVHELAREARTLTQRIARLELYSTELRLEQAAESWFREDFQRPESGKARVERLLAEGTAHGLPRDPQAERAVATFARTLDHRSEDQEPQAGAALRVRIFEREEERDRGMGF